MPALPSLSRAARRDQRSAASEFAGGFMRHFARLCLRKRFRHATIYSCGRRSGFLLLLRSETKLSDGAVDSRQKWRPCCLRSFSIDRR